MKKYFILAIMAAVTISGCTKDPVLPKDPSDNVDRLRYYQEIKDVRPDWTTQGFWEENDQYFQVGESFVFDTEREAKKDAMRDATFRLSEHVRQDVDISFAQKMTSEGETENTVLQYRNGTEMAKIISQSVMQSISVHETYTELDVDKGEKYGYRAFAIMKINARDLKNAINRAMSN